MAVPSHDLYIAEIYRPGTIFFAADSTGLSSSSSLLSIPRARKKVIEVRRCVTVIQLYSTSPKFVPTESLYAYLPQFPRYNDLLVE